MTWITQAKVLIVLGMKGPPTSVECQREDQAMARNIWRAQQAGTIEIKLNLGSHGTGALGIRVVDANKVEIIPISDQKTHSSRTITVPATNLPLAVTVSAHCERADNYPASFTVECSQSGAILKCEKFPGSAAINGPSGGPYRAVEEGKLAKGDIVIVDFSVRKVQS